MRFRALLAAACLIAVGPASAQSWAWDDGTVPFVVSPEEVVDRMLRIADIGPADHVIDLGSGDGRIVIGAAKRGARALGIDIDPTLVERARANAAAAGVSDRATFVAQDLFETDLSKASVVTMYLLPEVNLKLRPKLLTLKPGTRIVSHDWNMGDWEPDETIELRTPEKPVGLGGKSRVHLWIIPADGRGRWVAEIPPARRDVGVRDLADLPVAGRARQGRRRRARPYSEGRAVAWQRGQNAGDGPGRRQGLEPVFQGHAFGRSHLGGRACVGR